jgi:hypothetical protein
MILRVIAAIAADHLGRLFDDLTQLRVFPPEDNRLSVSGVGQAEEQLGFAGAGRTAENSSSAELS